MFKRLFAFLLAASLLLTAGCTAAPAETDESTHSSTAAHVHSYTDGVCACGDQLYLDPAQLALDTPYAVYHGAGDATMVECLVTFNSDGTGQVYSTTYSSEWGFGDPIEFMGVSYFAQGGMVEAFTWEVKDSYIHAQVAYETADSSTFGIDFALEQDGLLRAVNVEYAQYYFKTNDTLSADPKDQIGRE